MSSFSKPLTPVETATNIELTLILIFSSSCVDLIFTSLSNLFMRSGLHTPLYASCYRQTEFAEIDIKIHYSTPGEGAVGGCSSNRCS